MLLLDGLATTRTMAASHLRIVPEKYSTCSPSAKTGRSSRPLPPRSSWLHGLASPKSAKSSTKSSTKAHNSPKRKSSSSSSSASVKASAPPVGFDFIGLNGPVRSLHVDMPPNGEPASDTSILAAEEILGNPGRLLVRSEALAEKEPFTIWSPNICFRSLVFVSQTICVFPSAEAPPSKSDPIPKPFPEPDVDDADSSHLEVIEEGLRAISSGR
mmetsp:Transcript_110072/g.318221  ORF Transcript_110072/g.318221 Transcript_110072/m.318221 type:complete len:214 (-) Transcript_110072:1706-2347(-)